MTDQNAPVSLPVLYIIFDNHNNTYNGYTTDFTRRLRQHNGGLKGGAKYTTSRVSPVNKWHALLSITSPQITDKSAAMSLEWHIKYPTNRRPRPRIYSGPLGRIQSLPFVFKNPKFKDMQFYIDIHAPEFLNDISLALQDFPDIVFLRSPSLPFSS